MSAQYISAYRFDNQGWELGYVVDGDDYYLAIPSYQRPEDLRLGLVVAAEIVRPMFAVRENGDVDQFCVTPWDDELDRRLRELVKAIVQVRMSRPGLVQLEMFAEPELIKAAGL